MKIDRVRYDKKFSIGPYLTDSVGIEAQVDADETPELVLTTLKTIAEEWHKKEYSHLYAGHNPVSTNQYPEKEIIEIDKELDNMRKLLNDVEYMEDALNLLEKSSFKYHAEMKAIVKSKPSKK